MQDPGEQPGATPVAEPSRTGEDGRAAVAMLAQGEDVKSGRQVNDRLARELAGGQAEASGVYDLTRELLDAISHETTDDFAARLAEVNRRLDRVLERRR